MHLAQLFDVFYPFPSYFSGKLYGMKRNRNISYGFTFSFLTLHLNHRSSFSSLSLIIYVIVFLSLHGKIVELKILVLLIPNLVILICCYWSEKEKLQHQFAFFKSIYGMFG